MEKIITTLEGKANIEQLELILMRLAFDLTWRERENFSYSIRIEEILE
jgi:hypothetical protein